MGEQDISNALESVFHEVFDDPSITIHRDMTAQELQQWDSFNHVRLIVAVEECFEINFSTTEVADLKNVGELIDLISSHLARNRRAG
jgi:acyl carrier protein